MDYLKFEQSLGSWGPALKPFIESKECDIMYAELKKEAERGKKFCPLSANVFRAFKETPIEGVHTIFCALDPYPQILKDNVRIADGVGFSCSITEKYQPSLELFYNAIEEDIGKGLNLNWLRPYDLKYLCNQGVMMTNSSLTVERDKVGSHTQIWRPFMQFLYEEVFAKMPNGLNFVLCGKVSQELAKFINPLQHRIFSLEHPAFSARQMRNWRHEGIFSKLNYLLKTDKKLEVNWMYEESPF